MITSYATLQSAIADELNRTDLTEPIKTWIQLAEDEMRADERFRRVVVDSAFAIATGATVALPATFGQLKAWTHNGPNWYGAIETIGFDRLGELTNTFGLTGVPRYVAIDDVNLLAYLAPAADDDYTTTLVYEERIARLASASNNWILAQYPSAYFYGALRHSASFLKDPARIAEWTSLYDRVAELVNEATTRAQFSGTMRRRIRPIGG